MNKSNKTRYYDIVESLGVAPNQFFKVKFRNGEVSTHYYKFTNAGLTTDNIHKNRTLLNSIFQDLILGNITVVTDVQKVDVFPSNGDTYYYTNPYDNGEIREDVWMDDHIDKSLAKTVGVFQTPQEAEKRRYELGWVDERIEVSD